MIDRFRLILVAAIALAVFMLIATCESSNGYTCFNVVWYVWLAASLLAFLIDKWVYSVVSAPIAASRRDVVVEQ